MSLANLNECLCVCSLIGKYLNEGTKCGPITAVLVAGSIGRGFVNESFMDFRQTIHNIRIGCSFGKLLMSHL